jgi:hypothetical protein
VRADGTADIPDISHLEPTDPTSSSFEEVLDFEMYFDRAEDMQDHDEISHEIKNIKTEWFSDATKLWRYDELLPIALSYFSGMTQAEYAKLMDESEIRKGQGKKPRASDLSVLSTGFIAKKYLQEYYTDL